jgi:FkbM family methyltransferase
MTLFRIYDLDLDIPAALLSPMIERGLSKGWYERDEVDILRARLAPSDRVVEMGAGLGVTTLAAARIVGADALVAYEANADLIPIALDNARRNGLAVTIKNEILVPRAKSGTGFTDLYLGDQFWSSTVMGGSSGARRLPTRPLEDAIETLRANVLIMDIEGYEVEILEHCDLSPIDKLMFEIHYDVAGRDRTDAAIDRVRALGFRIDHQLSSRGVLYLYRPERSQ